jgi:hypothetical protein
VISHPSDGEVFTANFSDVIVKMSVVEHSKIQKRYFSMSLCSGLSPPLLLSA